MIQIKCNRLISTQWFPMGSGFLVWEKVYNPRFGVHWQPAHRAQDLVTYLDRKTKWYDL